MDAGVVEREIDFRVVRKMSSIGPNHRVIGGRKVC